MLRLIFVGIIVVVGIVLRAAEPVLRAAVLPLERVLPAGRMALVDRPAGASAVAGSSASTWSSARCSRRPNPQLNAQDGSDLPVLRPGRRRHGHLRAPAHLVVLPERLLEGPAHQLPDRGPRDDRRAFRTTLVVIALSLGFECAKQGWANLFIAPRREERQLDRVPRRQQRRGARHDDARADPRRAGADRDATWEKYAYQFLAVGVFMRGFTTYSRGGFHRGGGSRALRARALRAEDAGSDRRAGGRRSGLGGDASGILGPDQHDHCARKSNATNPRPGVCTSGRLPSDMARAKPLTGVGLNGFSSSYATLQHRTALWRGPSRRTARGSAFSPILGFPDLRSSWPTRLRDWIVLARRTPCER